MLPSRLETLVLSLGFSAEEEKWEAKVSIIPETRWRWRLDGSLSSHSGFSWLDPLFSVWRKWWRGPRPPALSRSVSHTSSPARASVCVCVWHQRARSTHFSANNHITQGKIHSNPPCKPPFVRWSDVGTAEGWRFGRGPDGGPPGPDEGKTWSTLIWLHITHVMEMLLSAHA